MSMGCYRLGPELLSISSFREPTTGPLWGPWRQAGTLTREERSLGKIESSCS